MYRVTCQSGSPVDLWADALTNATFFVLPGHVAWKVGASSSVVASGISPLANVADCALLRPLGWSAKSADR